MSIIDQLEKTVTPAVLGDKRNNVAYVSLLEQFYAILVARLAVPQVYSQLIRDDQMMVADSVRESSLFEQLWQDPSMQQVIVQELSATHHIDERATSQLLINTAPLAYHEFKVLANGQFLPAFLQVEQTALRQYLPIWAAPVIIAAQSFSDKSASNIASEINVITRNETSLDGIYEAAVETRTIAESTAPYVGGVDLEKPHTSLHDASLPHTHLNTNTNAIHANPSAHHWAENNSMKHEKVRTRNQRNDLLVRVFLLIVALAAMALAAWAIFIRPNNVAPVEPVVTEPVVVAPAPEPPATVMVPVELIVGVDNSGNLSSCSATVGDEALQGTLQQALNASFGEQASRCELNVQAEVANTIANLPAEVLPNVFTMLRSIPFARLHLQNDRLTLAAPDNSLLQRLVTDIRSLVPAMTIDSAAPLPLPNNGDVVSDMTSMNGMNPQFENGGITPNNEYGNNYNGGEVAEFQAPDDNTGDRVIPAPNNSGFNNNASNAPDNFPSNAPTNNGSINSAPTRPSGPISQSEVDEMASSIFVAEPAQVRQ
ncbi:hypothetical protein [Psychrobacter aquaticus]|uniref:Putative outer membrane protein, OmpA family n=1 Tax=Psychrobacter aquaticus CMS 56 TaxID=1354303 RepID=U4T2Z8_9GAMM|nr:hypothetical protein [Psychrobacter aquaticus]ERL55477.1 putative outer membrane protein, OmpA family [Psychrobacter aquaticus CMS 56]